MWILQTYPCTCVSCIDDNKYPTCRNSGAFHHSHIMATEKQCFHSDQENVKTSVSFLIPWKVMIQHSYQDIMWQKALHACIQVHVLIIHVKNFKWFQNSFLPISMITYSAISYNNNALFNNFFKIGYMTGIFHVFEYQNLPQV